MDNFGRECHLLEYPGSFIQGRGGHVEVPKCIVLVKVFGLLTIHTDRCFLRGLLGEHFGRNQVPHSRQLEW